jgi:rhodanese-related sulfurtransferase
MREIDPRTLAARLASGEPTMLVDVRESWEHALVALPESILLPQGDIASSRPGPAHSS